MVAYYSYVQTSTTITGKAKITVSDALVNGTRIYDPSSTTTINNCNTYNYVQYNIDDSFDH